MEAPIRELTEIERYDRDRCDLCAWAPAAALDRTHGDAVGATLGVGGMAEVKPCLDHHIGRQVALKVPLPQRREAEAARAHFLREARIQGQLEHSLRPPATPHLFPGG